MENTKLVIAVPAYNEEAMLPITVPAMLGVLNTMIGKKKISDSSRILFVNDGSRDNTWQEILDSQKADRHITGISFSRNSGHQNALIAGLEITKDADAIVTIDADLQDDIYAIEEMVDKFNEGYEVVYGVRNNRDTDSAFKRSTAMAFYKTMSIMGAKTIPNHADFRLLSRRAADAVLEFPERNLFLRGIIPLVGYKSTNVYYARKEREAGESKYPLNKMIKFAMDGITSFSTVPLRAILWLGVISVMVAIGLIIMTFIQNAMGKTTTGWSSLMVSVWFVGGAQLISLGVLGEYLGKVFFEVKRRPRFFIELDEYTEK
ncbi:glycosyltransferase family 2 protein [Weissella confusa]|uniref:glycosyltransferase family 2 protein n=1 Tax=Weissella confusa TaxID=1583 RepID=UPI00107F7237|nr:glycosyltransferase family 2 protein [Weissella confusa]MBJ7621785.1 glycosyltransferase family 2 protein [Weissella confusa]MBJ7676807.1 glycosyltransferase family 2 protein [Weissella confusa]MCS9990594.1 glycosyltransferase [Weissella confusa]MDY2522340.1 glycosyltransferase family 2 protein [Weissella confusa]QBZ02966.1 glycosyltransferase [Weissella confusa]